MSNIPIQYTLSEQKATVGPLKGKSVYIARPTGRKRISFRNVTEEVARHTTFAPEEVQAVINLFTKVAKTHVENGNIVEIGDLGTLTPSFKSQQVEKTERGEEAFNPNVHIVKPVVKLSPSRKYFELRGVSYERTYAKQVKINPTADHQPPTTPKPSSEGGGEHL